MLVRILNYFLVFVSVAVNKLQQKELNCQLCLCAYVYYRDHLGFYLTIVY